MYVNQADKSGSALKKKEGQPFHAIEYSMLETVI